MAITSVHEDFRNRGAAGYADKFRIWREADRAYVVQFDTMPSAESQVLTATDGSVTIPAYGAAHPNDSTLRVMNKRAAPRDESQFVWDVVVHYSTLAVATGINTNPLLQYPVISEIDSIELIEGVREWYPNLIPSTPAVAAVNSFGDPFDPPPETITSLPAITIVRNESSFSLDRFISYHNALNSDTFWGLPPGRVRLKLRYIPVDATGITYFRVFYRFEINTKPEGWGWKVVDQGSRGIYQTGTPPVDNFGTVPDEYFPGMPAGIVNLDGTGRVLARGQPLHFLGPYYQWLINPFQTLRLDPFGSSSVPFP